MPPRRSARRTVVSEKQKPPPSPNSLEALGLPDEITERYHAFGVREMFEWQAQCLSCEASRTGKNLVLCAPTSAGKTFVADVTTIRQLQRCGRKVLIVLPFISVAREKLVWLENLLHPLGYKIGGYMGPQHPSLPFEKLNVAICTIEKANSLVNSLIREQKVADLGLVVVDELHIICDPSRGYLLELLLTKLLFVTSDSSSPPQILGMSATLPNAKLLAKWLKAELFITDFRPVPLTEFVKCDNQLMDKEMKLVRILQPLGCPGVRDEDFVLSLVLETLLDGQSVLIFCPTKQWCESLSGSLAREMAIIRDKKLSIMGGKHLQPVNMEELEQIAVQLYRSPAGLDSVLSKTLSSGVAFHHAGLTMDERDIVESAFRRCIVRVLVATTTLSSGVNLPSRRVIIRSVMAGGAPIDVLSYRQMSGRAGRKGVDSLGESVLVCKTNERTTTSNLVKSQLPPLRSCLARPNSSLSGSLKRAILEVIAGGVAQSQDALNRYLHATLLAAEFLESGDLCSLSSSSLLEDCAKFLLSNKFIQLENSDDEGGKSRYVPTALGLAALHAALPPDDALAMIADLDRARQSLCLDSELHLVFLVTPIAPHWPEIDWNILSALWDQLPTELRRVAFLVGVREEFIAKAVAGRVSSSDPRQLRIHIRFLTALVLLDLINEMPLMRVATKYNCNKGFIQSLQQQAATFAGMTSTFCRELGWRHFDSLLASFQSRIAFGVQPELVDLLQVPFLTASVARHLFKNGLRKVEEVAVCDVQRLEMILLRFRPFENQNEPVSNEEVYVASEIPLTDRPSVTPGQAARFFIDLAKQVFQANHGENVQLVAPKSESAAAPKSASKSSTKSKRTSSELPQLNESPAAASTADKRRRKVSIATPSSVVIGQSTLDLFQSSINGACFTPIYHGVSLSQPVIGSTGKRTSLGGSLLGDASLLQALEKVEIASEDRVKEDPKVRKKFPPLPPNASSTPAAPTIITEPPSETKRSGVKFSPISDSLVGRIAAECEEEFEIPQPSSLQTEPQNKPLPPITPLGYQYSKPPLENGADTSTEENNMQQDDVKSVDDVPSFNVVEVAADRRLLTNFVTEWSQQTDFSFSIACAKIRADSLKGADDLNLELENGLRAVGIAVSYGGIRDVYYLSLKPLSDGASGNQETDDSDDSFVAALPGNTSVTLKMRLDTVKKVLESNKNPSRSITAFDARRHLRLLYQIGISPRDPFYDPRLACWILDPSDKGLTFHSLVLAYCDEEMAKMVACVSGCKARSSIATADSPCLARRFACIEAIAVRPLMTALKAKLAETDSRLWSAFAEVETPIDALIARMEMNGIGLDLKALEKLRQRMQTKLIQLEQEAQLKSGGRRFALSSLEDVAKVLFQDLRLPMDPDHMRRSGGRVVCSTNKTVLSRLRSKHPLPDIIMQWRRLSSALTKSVMAIQETATELPEAFPPPGCRIFFDCALIATGRINIIRPSLQLVPKDIPALETTGTSTNNHEEEISESVLTALEGDETADPQTDAQLAPFSLRQVFVPFSGCVLLTADYSQIELRLIAHLSKDVTLIAALRDQSVDVFCQMAADWYGIEGGAGAVSDEQRARTKQLVYAMLYGVGTRSLASSLGVSETEASSFLQRFQAKFPGIRSFINRTVAHARQHGFVTTLFGRRRMIGSASRRQLKEVNGRPASLSEHAERQAVNSVVQGSAADIVKKAMLDIERELMAKFPPVSPYASFLAVKHQETAKTALSSAVNRGARLVLHMHDELVFEVVERDLPAVVDIVRRGMEGAVPLAVPMPVKVRAGPSWASQNPV